MNVNKFLNYLVEKRKIITYRMELDRFQPMTALLTGLFKFPCKITNRGCTAYKDRKETCCCYGCYDHIGYFGFEWPNRISILSYYAQFFKPKTGFWSKALGCKLPREARSTICSNYVCGTVKEEFKKNNPLEFVNFHYMVGEFDGMINFNYGRNKKEKKRITNDLKMVTKALAEKYEIKLSPDMVKLWGGFKKI